VAPCCRQEDECLNVEPVADRFLRELRFGRDRAESTTKAYAGGIGLFLLWCVRTGREWRTAVRDMGLFMSWLKYTPAGDEQVVVLGPGAKPVLRAQHHLHEPETAVDRATDEEILALFTACRSARDRLIILLLARAGLRRSEAVGLRRADLHLLPDNRSLGCGVAGAHLHVIRRDNVNGAWAKSRNARPVGTSTSRTPRAVAPR
jgi:hypothetical protein